MSNHHLRKITFRLSEDEYKILEGRISVAGMSKSEFIRTAIFKVKLYARFTPDEKQILQTLINLGNNINQLSKKANQHQDFLTLATDLIHTKSMIDLILKKVTTI